MTTMLWITNYVLIYLYNMYHRKQEKGVINSQTVIYVTFFLKSKVFTFHLQYHSCCCVCMGWAVELFYLHKTTNEKDSLGIVPWGDSLQR